MDSEELNMFIPWKPLAVLLWRSGSTISDLQWECLLHIYVYMYIDSKKSISLDYEHYICCILQVEHCRQYSDRIVDMIKEALFETALD